MGRPTVTLPVRGGARDGSVLDTALTNIETELNALDGQNFRPGGLDRRVIDYSDIFHAGTGATFLWEGGTTPVNVTSTAFVGFTLGSLAIIDPIPTIPSGSRVHVRAALGFNLDETVYPWRGGIEGVHQATTLTPMATEAQLTFKRGGSYAADAQTTRRFRPNQPFPSAYNGRWASLVLDKWVGDDIQGVGILARVEQAGMIARISRAMLQLTVYPKVA